MMSLSELELLLAVSSANHDFYKPEKAVSPVTKFTVWIGFRIL